MDLSVRKQGPYVPEDHSWLGSAHGTEATKTITLDPALFTAATHFPNGYLLSGIVLAELTATPGIYGPYSGLAAEVQTVTITGAPTGGTFTLSFRGDVTAAIAFNATAAAVQTALESLPYIDPGDVTVTGGAGGPYTVTFGGRLTGDQPALVGSGTGLTGGTAPAVAVATTTAGGSAVVTGMQTAKGHLFASVLMVTGAPKMGAALLEHGAVKVTNLPPNHGLDAAARNQLKGNITYR